MIWLNGLNHCPDCFKERRNMTDKEAYIKAVIRDIDNLVLGAVKPLNTGERARVFKAVIHSIESKLFTEGEKSENNRFIQKSVAQNHDHGRD